MLAQLDDLYVSSKLMIPWLTFLIAIGGSFHCLGMCGGLVSAFTHNHKSNATYQIGRLMGYLLVGVIASFIGALIKNYVQSNTITLLTTFFMGSILIYWGVKILWKKSYTLKVELPSFMNIASKKLYKSAHNLKKLNSYIKSSMIGFLSIFLPCGFLYGLVIVVAMYEDPFLSLISMFTFWLGTLPMLIFSTNIIQKIILPLKNKTPILASMMLISLGLITITTRFYQFYTTGSCH